ncbi:pilus biosynthesis protein HicB [Dehalococcoides mccartyi CG1]|jgi:antitoxin HicB|uniref:type II toxin-antitoxin system HicB family antitoxin n=1 Tax=Dehalococcoides mccartyi TaxID=61435 RepID=UPI0004E08175|nr:type II toxin-antitoxin system HicB family antitoxin [Dehalococcoides mccartyi]AII58084.1 pilus biosynthesis protein HicB [Dehalococcoides mccartyi CG1]
MKTASKNLDYYMELPYTVVIEPDEDNDGGTYYVARALELSGCIGDGDTPEEALESLAIHKRMWLEDQLERGYKIPEPQQKFSGKFNVRVGPELHRKLSQKASMDKMSLNQFVTEKLAEAVGS